ncbi:MAG TPA: tetratricopeptide repeat protein [Tepidisphaeraceae bacterium]|jgi:tetratricopeptide (TPR) repeat protein
MTRDSADQILNQAVSHHQAGRLHEAESLYRQIVAAQPEHAMATHNLGVLHRQLGKNEQAVAFIRRAISLDPNWTEAYFNLANILQEQNRLEEAIAAWQQVIVRWPSRAEAHWNLGVLLQKMGQLDQAIAAYQRASTAGLNSAEFYNTLGTALILAGRPDEAITAIQQAIARQPDFADAFYNLALALKDKKELDQGIGACQKALALRPNFPQAWNNLGIMLLEQKQHEAAINAFRHLVALCPDDADALHRLALALAKKGKHDEAIALCRQASELDPQSADIFHSLAVMLTDTMHLEEAAAAARQAISLEPDHVEAHMIYATLCLLTGKLREGWQEYAWRLKRDEFAQQKYVGPEWSGDPLQARTILLYSEQGYGDALQFIRYVPLVAERGGQIVVRCRLPLKRLFELSMQAVRVVTFEEPLPDFDLHCSLMSLPRVLETDLSNIPARIPYLFADSQQIATWRTRLAKLSDKPKIGLAWRGASEHANDHNRSIALKQLAPLAEQLHVQFVNLNKNNRAGEINDATFPIIDWTNELHDFADTAALVANLDLVISVDTAVAHLAGAMGKPVWMLLPYLPDWRWMLEREDSPWYPTMRLFRQNVRGDWEGVIRRISDALKGNP